MSANSKVKEYYVRFARMDRVEHLLLLVSFTVLVITGIPQKYAPAPWAMTMINWMGGVETVRIIHRLAAIIMIIESAYHILAVGYKLYVRRVSPAMLPSFQDVIDFIDAIRYNLGLARNRPKYDRYSFEEKLEYWAVVWGTGVMVLTGFMLWNPISITRFFPGSWIPAAKAAHGGEALLAFLAIVVWHMYNVHLKTFNRSIFTGKLTREQMEHEHGRELERIEAGDVRPEPPREVIRRRERIYLPFAFVSTLIFVVVLYFFITYEQTAIATVPPLPEQGEAFVRATPTPTPTPDPEQAMTARRSAAPPIPHAISEGREDCLSCHGLGAIQPFTPFHDELALGNETCLSCHVLLETNNGELPTVEALDIPSFASSIRPIINAKCVACHGTSSSLNLISYRSLMQGGASGPVIIPGDPDHSRLLLVQSMPVEAHPTRLTPEQLERVRLWIAAGAPNN
ncbi:MAG: cytochrome b/b6 domain-containing protein [Caldilineales bacterium]|nr:cytochrome b/b6 domain-containing protein [Caldilineales bacterium]